MSYQRNAQSPYAANYGRADYGQIAPGRDVAEPNDQEPDNDADDARQRANMAAAIAPQAPQMKPSAPAGPDYSQQQRAQLQSPGQSYGSYSGGLQAPAQGPANGSLSSLGRNAQPRPSQGGGVMPPRYGQGAPVVDSGGSLPGPSTGGLSLPPHSDQINADGSGGIAGLPAGPHNLQLEGQPAPAPQAQAPQRAQFDPTRMSGGWNLDKFNGDHDSPKYDMGRILAGFDPRQGLTPEAMAALNASGLGQFSRTSDDKVHVENGDPRFNGLTDIDLIQGFGTGNGLWNFEDANGGGQQPGGFNAAAAFGQTSYTPQEEQLAQSLGLDTNNPMWRQILEQLTSGGAQAPH